MKKIKLGDVRVRCTCCQQMNIFTLFQDNRVSVIDCYTCGGTVVVSPEDKKKVA